MPTVSQSIVRKTIDFPTRWKARMVNSVGSNDIAMRSPALRAGLRVLALPGRDPGL